LDQEDVMRPSVPGFLLPLLALSIMVGCSDRTGPATDVVAPALKASNRVAFGFNGSVSGFPTGEVRLTGGGSFDPTTASNTIPDQRTSAASAGGFTCTGPVAQGPLTGCQAGEGVRWDTAQLLASTGFKCTASDAVKTAVTGDKTAVLLADFYRAGDGNDESFTAQMIVSDSDLAPLIDGIQNVWVQGVGCGTAIVDFN
jgi:hypothetical protein